MTEVEQNIAIAECCGWKRVDTGFGFVWEAKGNELEPPNYVRSLDAMHVAEGFIPESLHTLYNGILIRLTKSYVQLYYDGVTSSMVEHFKIIHATAAQKAEAFLKVFNKWV